MFLSHAPVRRRLSFIFFPFLLLTTILVLRSFLLHPPPPNPPIHTKHNPIYKPEPTTPPPPPITDNFPLAALASSPSDIPPIPPWNNPPTPHVKFSTPLFIGFTRNWRLLQQTVVSYITAGWPAADIHVVENTGVMQSNLHGQLSLQNPFFLNHTRLTGLLGVEVIRTPTLFTFAQLQNFYVSTALERGWDHYFWAHMDTVVVSDEEYPPPPSTPEDGSTPNPTNPRSPPEYKSLYTRATEALQETLDPAWGPLATRWFAYDRLALVRTQAFLDVGGWDTMIPFYMTDCDMHERLWMAGLKIEDAAAGLVWDVAETLEDLGELYMRDGGETKLDKRDGRDGMVEDEEVARRSQVAEAWAEATARATDDTATALATSATDTPPLASPLYHALLTKLDILQTTKSSNPLGRNTWQARQRGGKDEPFYRDPEGFELGVGLWMDFGRRVFEEKWGRSGCDLRDSGLVAGDAWRVVGGWDDEVEEERGWLGRWRWW